LGGPSGDVYPQARQTKIGLACVATVLATFIYSDERQYGYGIVNPMQKSGTLRKLDCEDYNKAETPGQLLFS
jgi:hypothetical protein